MLVLLRARLVLPVLLFLSLFSSLALAQTYGFTPPPASSHNGSLTMSWNVSPDPSLAWGIAIYESTNGGSTWSSSPIHATYDQPSGSITVQRGNGNYKYKMAWYWYSAEWNWGDSGEIPQSGTSTVQINIQGAVTGLTHSNGTYYVSGWACQQYHWQPIAVQLLVGGPSGTFLKSATANTSVDSSASAACSTSGVAHRFSIPLTTSERQTYGGQGIYVRGISGNSLVNTLLSNGGTYTVPVPLPGNVPDLTVSPAISTNGAHTVSWPVASGVVDYYQLWRNQTLIYSGLVRSQPYTDLPIGHYQYDVRACNSSGCSAYKTAWADVQPPTPSTPVISASPNPSTDGDFTVSWTQASGDVVTGYFLYQGSTLQPLSSDTATSKGYSGFTNGTYPFAVAACNVTGCSAYATVNVVVNIPSQYPGTPPSFDISSGLILDGSSYTLSWGTSSGTVTGYVLQERKNGGLTGNGGYDWTSVYSGSGLSYVASERGEGRYDYRVKALNSSLESSYAGILSAEVHDLGGLTTEVTAVTPTAMGNVPYQVGVSANGAAQLNIPIQLVPGIHNFMPELSLAYSSARGRVLIDESYPSDILGYGWRLAGQSSIRRCVAGQGSSAQVEFDNTDALCFGGAPLVLVSGTHWQPGAVYRTKRDGYHLVELKGTVAEPWFEVKAPSGSVSEFGNTTDSRVRIVSASQNIPYFNWSLNKVTDSFGNEINYSYHKDQISGINYPLSISYGDNGDASVQFEYVARPDTSSIELGGVLQTQMVLLHSIVVQRGTVPVRRYRLISEAATEGWRRLREIQLCGYDSAGSAESCMDPLAIQWQEINPDMPGLQTVVSSVVDSKGGVNEFTHQYIRQGHTHDFLFNERPFGNFSLPSGAQYLSSATAAEPLLLVVTSHRRSNGIGGLSSTRYAYQGLPVESTNNWGLLGFPAQRIIDDQTGVATYTQRRLDDPLYYGAVAAIHQYDDVYGSHTEMLAKAEHQYGFYSVTHPNSAVTAVPYLSRTTQFTYEANTLLGATETFTSHFYDSQGLVTATSKSGRVATTVNTPSHTPAFWGDVPTHTLSDVVHTSEKDSQFQNRTSGGQWLVGFATDVDTRQYDGAVGGSGVTELQQSVDITPHTSSNAVASATRFPGHSSLELTTSYAYDSYGNPTDTTVAGVLVASRTSSVSNLLNKRYPQTLTNALYHNTYVDSYDLRFGAPTQVTDPNGRVSSTSYDPFGRTISNTNPDGVTASTAYEDCDLVYCEMVGGVEPSYRVVTDSPVSPEQIHYFDSLDRVIRSETEAFDGSTLRSDVFYDDRGRIDHYSLPYFSGTTPKYVYRSYDLRNRLVSETKPDGGSLSITRQVNANQDGMVITRSQAIKAANGSLVETKVKQEEYNLLGQLVETTDAHGTADAVTTSFTYDAAGQVLSTTVDGGADGTTTATLEYDAAGNRTKLIDPDAGTAQFYYTALGQMWKQTNNSGQASTYAFDLLGRVTARTYDGYARYFEYDSSGGIGMLSRIDLPGSYDEVTYSYSQGRLQSQTTTAFGAGGGGTRVLTTSYGYDSYGRPNSITYPEGFKAEQVYNSRGYLSGIRSHSSNASNLMPGMMLQSFDAVDAFGNVTSESYGNGVETVRVYDPQSGRLEAIETALGSTLIQDTDYGWRSNGILETRSNHLQGAEESFSYDVLGRLTQANTTLPASGTRALSYHYDKLGNLLSKISSVSGDDQVTGYEYAGTQPHAVTEATINGGVTTLTYNANGAVTRYDAPSGPDRFLAYNFDNQPTTIVQGTSLSDTNPEVKETFRYLPDGTRYYRVSDLKDATGSPMKTHYFYAGAYEEVKVVQATYNKRTVKRVQVSPNVMVVRVGRINQWGSLTWEERVEFLHRDHLGSVEKITDDQGAVLHTLAYEPFGARRAGNWAGQELGLISLNPDMETLTQELGIQLAWGYTGHEHLDRTGFIHMNGRIYDPQLGRFLSPDPIVQAPTNSQNWNRYSYVFNSPLSYTDPSGYSACQDHGAANPEMSNAEAVCAKIIYELISEGRRPQTEPFDDLQRLDWNAQSFMEIDGQNAEGSIPGLGGSSGGVQTNDGGNAEGGSTESSVGNGAGGSVSTPVKDDPAVRTRPPETMNDQTSKPTNLPTYSEPSAQEHQDQSDLKFTMGLQGGVRIGLTKLLGAHLDIDAGSREFSISGKEYANESYSVGLGAAGFSIQVQASRSVEVNSFIFGVDSTSSLLKGVPFEWQPVISTPWNTSASEFWKIDFGASLLLGIEGSLDFGTFFSD